jgi:hypothetical protein
MSPRRDLGPWQVALLSLLGSALAGILFLFPKMPMHWPLWLRLITGLGLLASGFTIYLKFLSAFRDGVQNHRWTEQQLQSLRLVLESPYCKAFNISLILAYAVFVFLIPHLKGVGWVCFLFTMNLSQLIVGIRRPRPESSNSLLGWRDLSPIRSDHWGQR